MLEKQIWEVNGKIITKKVQLTVDKETIERQGRVLTSIEEQIKEACIVMKMNPKDFKVVSILDKEQYRTAAAMHQTTNKNMEKFGFNEMEETVNSKHYDKVVDSPYAGKNSLLHRL